MDEREERRQELLQELARRFQDSARNLKKVAQRINSAAQTHHSTVKRMNQQSLDLRSHVEADSATVPFTYLEYLEFHGVAEFQKFRDEPIITAHDIDAVDWDSLTQNLQAE